MRNRDWLIHVFFSTSSVCMIAIWPVDPPKEMKPSFSQKRNASGKDGPLTRALCPATSDNSRFINKTGTSNKIESADLNARKWASVFEHFMTGIGQTTKPMKTSRLATVIVVGIGLAFGAGAQ